MTMRISAVSKSDFAAPQSPHCLVVPLFQEGILSTENLDSDISGALRPLIEDRVFQGKAEEAYYLTTPGGPRKGILALGLGKRDAFNAEVLRRGAGKVAGILRAQRVSSAVFDASENDALPLEAFVEGIMLGQYRFARYKEAPADADAPVQVEDVTILIRSNEKTEQATQRLERVGILCDNANWARDLANTPSNELTPTALGDAAKAMAKQAGCTCEVIDEDHMQRLGMNALLGVAKGSENRARLIVVHYHHADNARTLCLVGKGVTFDTGGISIKPPQNMHEMKFDMCGAAAVLGAVKSAAELKLPINVVVVVPAAENMPGANAQKPGDIVKAYNGKTIQVDNTDAEGRLLLADALSYAVDKFKPERMIDIATLTGGVLVALGNFAAGVMSNNESLVAALQRASDETGERIWRLPLWSDYDKLLETPHADITNIGPPRIASSIIGGCFLKNFVGDTPWAHLDIAGTAYGVKNVSYLDTDHATGFGVRLLAQWLANEAENARGENGSNQS
jgi:leucyl aminopeptidase